MQSTRTASSEWIVCFAPSSTLDIVASSLLKIRQSLISKSNQSASFSSNTTDFHDFRCFSNSTDFNFDMRHRSDSDQVLIPEEIDSQILQVWPMLSATLLSHLIVHWQPCMALKSQHQLLYSLFILVPPVMSLKSLISGVVSLSKSVPVDDQQRVALEISNIIHGIFLEKNLEYILQESKLSFRVNTSTHQQLRGDNRMVDFFLTYLCGVMDNSNLARAEFDRSLSLVLSLPDRMIAALQGNFSQDFHLRPEKYFPALVDSVFRAFEIAYTQLPESSKRAAEILSRIQRLGYSASIGSQFVTHLMRIEADADGQKNICFHLFWSFSTSNLDVLLEAIISAFEKLQDHEKSARLVSLLFSDVPVESLRGSCDTVYRCLTKGYFLTRPKSLFFLKVVVDILQSHRGGAFGKNDLLYTATRNILEVWSDTSLLKQGSMELQKYISIALQACLQKLGKEDAESSMLLPLILRGIQIHLDHPLSELKRQGMITAEIFSRVIDPLNPLKLRDDEDEIESPNLSASLHRNFSSENIHLQEPENLHTKESSTLKKQAEDPDQDVFQRNNQNDSASDSDSDESLEAYDLQEDTKTQDRKKFPKYLRVCWENIRSQETELVQGAFSVAEELIRKNDVELDDLCVPFTRSMLHIENESGVPDFAEKKRKILTALIASRPALVARFLCQQFYGRDYDISQRILMLEVMELGAEEISNVHVSEAAQFTANKLVQMKPVLEQTLGKTRRTHQKPKPIHAAPNPFHNVAPYFFYGLFGNYDKTPAGYDDNIHSAWPSAGWLFCRILHNCITMRSVSN
eukprot:TRINITY_DN4056_c0_g1_i4.p1 TRINITY_DN4056_c0_g1~~TRINITY_DN4056_c0_g1_i4.p1  ORF type:complete len:802 (+),score=135.75 TRINITY_DN4056_c0_g1_i4:75-2480(+)